ncbi:hypothetical protein [Lactococcus cremoris]|uniref:hypothetical protein n=1 Tax=Lactococcus lactis subsp. cremoris TaxID=1359 RepID=UPI00218217D9|nr:hypothetical protein [Lactococcus cremoris]MCT0501741.1 hypothetical protein [Lactococcus cremoris]
MSYEKQTWNKYDDLKTEEENIENGAVVTDNRMNHMESGIGDNDTNLASHLANTANPHKVTAAQVGLGNVQNFGLATEDEAKQGISNAKYMTPSLTQAVLSANINTIAYANSADGTDGFTTVYPNLNLLKGTKTPKSITGDNTVNQGWLLYSFDNNNTLTNQGFSINDTVTLEFDWNATNPASGSFKFQWQGEPWLFNVPTINLSSTNGSGHVIHTFNIRDVDIASTAVATGIGCRFDNIPTNTVITFSNVIIRKAKSSQPWMPSSSEVTADDWPKFVGFSNTVKTNKSASDYTWFPVKDSELTNKVESHINNKDNPHAVTASQVGAYSKQEIDTKLSKAVMTDDTGKAKLTDFEVTMISETVNIGNGLSLNFQRKGEFVLVRFSGSLTAINSGTYFSTAVPEQWRPDGIKELIGHFASGTLAFHVDLETDGRVKWWGASGATGAPRGTAMYFLK